MASGQLRSANCNSQYASARTVEARSFVWHLAERSQGTGCRREGNEQRDNSLGHAYTARSASGEKIYVARSVSTLTSTTARWSF